MTNPNDPAHPQHGWSSDPQVLERMKDQGGMTKREYFAAMAMQGYLATDHMESPDAKLAYWSVQTADALIAALNESPKEGAKP